MRALVTNDDGIESVGLHLLASLAHEHGWAVTVAAPAWDASGASASLTAVEEDGRLELEPRELPGLDGVAAFAVQAAPAYITRVALGGAFGDPPDVVLSGVNRGPNTGRAILHSGTVGAALTAVNLDCRACAVSLDARGRAPHWDAVVEPMRAVLRFLELDPPIAVNVNVPDRPPHEIRGMRAAELASFGAVQTTVTEEGQGQVRVEYSEIAPHGDPESDAALLADGFVTLTALKPVCGVPEYDWTPLLNTRSST